MLCETVAAFLEVSEVKESSAFIDSSKVVVSALELVEVLKDSQSFHYQSLAHLISPQNSVLSLLQSMLSPS